MKTSIIAVILFSVAATAVSAQSNTQSKPVKPGASQGTSGATVPQGNRVKGTTEQNQASGTEETQSQGTSSQGTAAWPMSTGTAGSTTLPPESDTPTTTGEKQGTQNSGSKANSSESQGTSSQGTAAWPQSSGTTGGTVPPPADIQGNTTSPSGSENSSDVNADNAVKRRAADKRSNIKQNPDKNGEQKASQKVKSEKP